MSHENDDRRTRGSDSGSETASKEETFGEALEKAGFKPLNAGRKAIGQGKTRETLRKGSPKALGKCTKLR